MRLVAARGQLMADRCAAQVGGMTACHSAEQWLLKPCWLMVIVDELWLTMVIIDEYSNFNGFFYHEHMGKYGDISEWN